MTGGWIGRLRESIGIAPRRPASDGPATLEEMYPRPGLFSVGTGDFRAIGHGILEELKASAGLAPHHRVLDVGCGIGRTAIPMTQYLSPQGSYEGFDPVAKAIAHCQQRITPSYPNFRFQVADLYNKRYNPRGRYRDSDYRFPFDDASFDVVFAVSVFTHLLPEGAARYVAESARVLKPGGRFFATFFLLDDAALAAMDAGRSAIAFPVRYPDHSVHQKRVPEAAVAFPADIVTGLCRGHGLELEPPRYGVWSGRATDYGGLQDLLVGTKKAG